MNGTRMRQVIGRQACRRWESVTVISRAVRSGPLSLAMLAIGTFVGMAGCSPPPPTTADAELAVEMPDQGAAAGSVATPLDPPELTDVDGDASISSPPDPRDAEPKSADVQVAAADQGETAGNAPAAATSPEAVASPASDPLVDPDPWRSWPHRDAASP